VADGARKVADGAQQGYNAALPHVKKVAAGLVTYGGQAKDVLSGMASQVPPMEFDADAVRWIELEGIRCGSGCLVVVGVLLTFVVCCLCSVLCLLGPVGPPWWW
jgi:hypothetical protein